MTSTCGCRASTSRSSAARAAVTLAPVGLCARGVQITARAPAASARSSPSGVIPEASTATGSASNPFSRSVLMCARKHGSSTATASPRVRCAASSRSIASTAPWVTTTSNGPGRSNRSRASVASAGNSGGAPYKAGRVAGEVWTDVREQRRVRVPARHAGRVQPCGVGRPVARDVPATTARDRGPAAPVRLRHPGGHQLPVRGGHRVAVHAQLGGQRADRRQRVARADPAGADEVADARRDACCCGAADAHRRPLYFVLGQSRASDRG